MATINFLKDALRQKAKEMSSSPKKPLSDSQYDSGFQILTQHLGKTKYEDFIIPQLLQLLNALFNARISISILEIGPGPRSILGGLPIDMRRKIKKYTAYEPNGLFAAKLQRQLCPNMEQESMLPCLEHQPVIRRVPFDLGSKDSAEKYDVVLFCHSMYGLEPKRSYIERALSMLDTAPESTVVVFHRAGSVHFEGLTCNRTALFPQGRISVEDSDEVIDCFARFSAGFVLEDAEEHQALEVAWREICRDLACRLESLPGQLIFSSPDMMVAFSYNAVALPELTCRVSMAIGSHEVKNREARMYSPASVMKPAVTSDVQECVRWALDHGSGLTVIGGGHSGQCVWPNVVAVDMSNFNQLDIVTSDSSEPVVVVGTGCTSGDIIRQTIAAGLTVPLGSRPSVGAGLYLQGGIGHLARQHGLACDAIIGAVLVSVATGNLVYVGDVPSQCRPRDAVGTEDDTDLLWALKGAGTNFGIVISVAFKAYTAPMYTIRNWMIPINDTAEGRRRLHKCDEVVASKLPRNRSADAYLYWEADKLHLGISMCDSSTTGPTPESTHAARKLLGPVNSIQIVDCVGLFDTELYMAGMHGGHAGGKTSSFKRCMFLQDIGAVETVDRLMKAIKSRPTPNCYLHLLQGGGAVSDVPGTATAFGCRDWNFACVITGVRRRDEDGTEKAHAAIQWVYDVAADLLPVSTGCYGADLGPDPRDATLARRAFGPNLARLARLKRNHDPSNVLDYACPLPDTPMEPKLIILVTGDSCAGKDYCAEIWQSTFANFKTRVSSISDATKQEYAKATGADLARLLGDREYKEGHRAALTKFFQDQVHKRPQLPEEQFLNVVHDAHDVDVLLITGMRDVAPIAAFSHLVPDSRLLEVKVKADPATRRDRRGQTIEGEDEDSQDADSCPSFVFRNTLQGRQAAEDFAKQDLLPFFQDGFDQLSNMVRSVPNFPRRGIDFRDVLGISQQPDGLELCTSMLQSLFTGDWDKVGTIASCGIGGMVFASPLAVLSRKPLALIREAGKRPPPAVSTPKRSSHISSSAPASAGAADRIEMDRDMVHAGTSVLVVDDVLASGETLCSVLELLCAQGVDIGHISVLVVAEFPAHRGRQMLRSRGFGRVLVESLLVFGGK